jgi:hypothetical protein
VALSDFRNWLRAAPDRSGKADASAKESPQHKNLRSTWSVLLSWAALSLSALILFAVQQDRAQILPTASGAVLLAAASASFGALMGFLFGIPRSLQGEAPVVSESGAGSADSAGGQRLSHTGLRVNTNLEQISDWLTKILVGVGLTQLQVLWPNLMGIAKDVSGPLGNSQPLALFTLVNFSIWGFFAAYLVTRLFLATAFGHADLAAERVDRELNAAATLASQGAFTAAAGRFSTALQNAGGDATLEQRQKACEGQVYSHLYEAPPDGFRRAIAVASSFISSPLNVPRGKLWAYLAAAYGQAYRFESQLNPGSPQLPDLEAKALDAVKRALAATPELKTLLRSLWDPNDPTKAGIQEDDLEVFHDRPAFQALLQ